MANLTNAQAIEINSMCEGANRNSIGSAIKAIQENFSNVLKQYNLGTPIVATTNRIVTSTNMKVGSYTIAAQPDVPRNITVTHSTVATGTDTLGTITITGTDINDAAISEVITPSADATVVGNKAFKTITSVVGAGWVIAGGNDTIVVGVGAKLGLPVLVSAAANVHLGFVGTATVVPTVAVSATVISSNTVDLSSGTYDGSKKVYIQIAQ